MEYSKLSDELGTINMLYSPKKVVIFLHPYLLITATSPQWPLSSVPLRWPLWRGSTIFFCPVIKHSFWNVNIPVI